MVAHGLAFDKIGLHQYSLGGFLSSGRQRIRFAKSATRSRPRQPPSKC